MARKYVNFRVGGSPYKETDAYTVWTNDLLGKVIASKTIIQPGQSTEGPVSYTHLRAHETN